MASDDVAGPPPGDPGDFSSNPSMKLAANADHYPPVDVPKHQANSCKIRGETEFHNDDPMDGNDDNNEMNGEISRAMVDFNPENLPANTVSGNSNADDVGTSNNANAIQREILVLADDSTDDDDDKMVEFHTNHQNKANHNAIRGETIVLNDDSANDDKTSRISKNIDVDDPIDAFHLFLTNNPNLSAAAIQSVLTSRKSTADPTVTPFGKTKKKPVPAKPNAVVAANAPIEVQILKQAPTPKTAKNNETRPPLPTPLQLTSKCTTETVPPSNPISTCYKMLQQFTSHSNKPKNNELPRHRQMLHVLKSNQMNRKGLHSLAVDRSF